MNELTEVGLDVTDEYAFGWPLRAPQIVPDGDEEKDEAERD
jgi:hypothetical protein